MKKTTHATTDVLSSILNVVASVALALLATTELSAQTITLTGAARDFSSISSNPNYNLDFENATAGVETGIVLSTLGADKTPVFNPAHPALTVHGPDTFAQWYHDSSATFNIPVSITLNDAGTAGDSTSNDGIFTYASNAFFPLDDLGYGNEGRAHNYSFTYELHARFGYDSSLANTFTFTGDDDVWVFINNQLAIDLGGTHPATSQSIDLNSLAGTLALLNGQNYDLDLFFAERHTSESDFTMETTLALTDSGNPSSAVPEPSTYGLIGAAVLGTVAYLRRRRLYKS